MSVNDKQVGGSHYKASGIQHWDLMVDIQADYLQGACTKYLSRWRKKNGVQDLMKAAHFLEKMIESVEKGALVNQTIRKGKEKIRGEFYRSAQISYPDSLLIDTVLTWYKVEHLKLALVELESLIAIEEDHIDPEEDAGPTSAYVNQG